MKTLHSRKRILLVSIFLVAYAFRVILIDKYPFGFTADEASFGYDAYSIAKTSKDQWGKTIPIVLESFGDFKLPLYSYLAAPFVILFGLDEWVIRLPNALIGSFAVVSTYLLAKEIFIKNKNKYVISLLSSMFLAVSSWHVMLSRGAFEANLSTFFLPLGAYSFLKGTRKNNKKDLVFSALVLGTNLFTYHAARLITPAALLLMLAIIWKKSIHLRVFYPFMMVFLIFVAITFYSFALGGGQRAKDISIFSGASEEAAVPRLELIEKGVNPKIARLIHNKFIVSGERFVSNYVEYFSPSFFLINGPGEATYGMIPGRGVLYVWEFVLLLLGIYLIYKSKEKGGYLLFLLFLLSAVPSALAQGVGHAANRASNMMPYIQIMSAYGFVSTFANLKSGFKKVGLILMGFFVCFSVFRFAYAYIDLSPFKSAEAMHYGKGDLFRYLDDIDEEYKNIYLSRSLSAPNIWVAFYQEVEPNFYQKNTLNWVGYRRNSTYLDQFDEYKLGKYVIGDLYKIEQSDIQNVLLVGKPEDFESQLLVKNTFYYPNGQVSYVVKEK